jgi:hypothetical protein
VAVGGALSSLAMKNFSKLVVGVAFGLGLAACGSKGDDLVGKVTSFKNKVCACKDADCAEKERDAYRAWRSEAKKAAKPSDDVIKKLQAVEKEMGDCQDKLREAAKPATPTTPPPAAPTTTLTEPAGSGSAAPAGSGSAQ